MPSHSEIAIKDAMEFARAGRLQDAQERIRSLRGRLSANTLVDIGKEIAWEYLVNTPRSIGYGIVTLDDFHINVTDGGEYIGISTDTGSFFDIDNPTYIEGVKHEVLFRLGEDLFYINLGLKGKPYGGLVVGAGKGMVWAMPYFDLEQIKTLALECVLKLENKVSHVWELPADFGMYPEEYADVCMEQARLAIAHYELPLKEKPDDWFCY